MFYEIKNTHLQKIYIQGKPIVKKIFFKIFYYENFRFFIIKIFCGTYH